jgi:uncharacterized membrane protein YczE
MCAEDTTRRTVGRYMKDAPLLRGPLPIRLVSLFGGLMLIAVAVVAMLESGFGLPPWDVFHMGIAAHTPLELGTASVIVGLVILVAAWIAGVPPGFGTVANAVVIGLTIDLLTAWPAVGRLAGAAVGVRLGLVGLGVVLFGAGSAFYMGAGLGAGPRDSLMMAISKRTGRRIGLVRGAIEIAVLIAGLALGGRAGAGTLTLALLVGPSVETSFWLLEGAGLATRVAGKVAEFGPLDAG